MCVEVAQVLLNNLSYLNRLGSSTTTKCKRLHAQYEMFWTFMHQYIVTAQVFEVHQPFEALCSKAGHTPPV